MHRDPRTRRRRARSPPRGGLPTSTRSAPRDRRKDSGRGTPEPQAPDPAATPRAQGGNAQKSHRAWAAATRPGIRQRPVSRRGFRRAVWCRATPQSARQSTSVPSVRDRSVRAARFRQPPVGLTRGSVCRLPPSRHRQHRRQRVLRQRPHWRAKSRPRDGHAPESGCPRRNDARSCLANRSHFTLRRKSSRPRVCGTLAETLAAFDRRARPGNANLAPPTCFDTPRTSSVCHDSGSGPAACRSTSAARACRPRRSCLPKRALRHTRVCGADASLNSLNFQMIFESTIDFMILWTIQKIQRDATGNVPDARRAA